MKEAIRFPLTKAVIDIHPQQTAHEEQWEDLAGAWSDLPDDMLEELDRLLHL